MEAATSSCSGPSVEDLAQRPRQLLLQALAPRCRLELDEGGAQAGAGLADAAGEGGVAHEVHEPRIADQVGVCGAEARPVEARRHALDGLLNQGRFQFRQHIGQRHHGHAMTFEQFENALIILAGHAGVLPQHAEVDGSGRQPALAAVLRQRVLEEVGRGVVHLPVQTQHRRDRRKHHEEIKLRARGARRLVQVPGALGLGAEHPREADHVHGRQRRVVQDAGAMDDAGQRRHLGLDAIHQASHGGPVRDILLCQKDLDSLFHHGLDSRPVRIALTAAAAHEDQMARARVGHPAGYLQAESGCAAGDQVRAVGAERGVRGGSVRTRSFCMFMTILPR